MNLLKSWRNNLRKYDKSLTEVWSDDSYNTARGKGECHSLHQNIVTECLADIIGFNDNITQSGTGRELLSDDLFHEEPCSKLQGI